MASAQQQDFVSNRIHGLSGITVDLLKCPICFDLLRDPVACQACETPFCAVCIEQWLIDNPEKCPNRCEAFIQRKCPPFIAKLLSQIEFTCPYQSNGCQQIILYEAMEKHELQCDYRPHQCPGCQLQMLKKEFDNHVINCASIELTCEDCKVVYKKDEGVIKHTENICLKEQLRQLRNESKENQRQLQELTRQLTDITVSQNRLRTEINITFNDLGEIPEDNDSLPDVPLWYRGFKWTNFNYMNESYAAKNDSKSGFEAVFQPGCSTYIVFSGQKATIGTSRLHEAFTLISLHSCAAWNDGLKLTITGHRNSERVQIHTATLLFGKPQAIYLQWQNIDKVIFKSFGGRLHQPAPRRALGANHHFILTQLTLERVD